MKAQPMKDAPRNGEPVLVKTPEGWVEAVWVEQGATWLTEFVSDYGPFEYPEGAVAAWAPLPGEERTNKNQPVAVYFCNEFWRVQTVGEHNYRACETEEEARDLGRQLAKKRGCELIVYRKDGTVLSKDTFVKDPFPPSNRG